MPFEKIKSGRGNFERTEPDKVYLAVYGSRENNKPHHIAIRIGRELAERINWKTGSRLAILEGSGEDAGFVKIVPSEDEGYKAAPTNPRKPNGDIVLQPLVSGFRYHRFNELRLAQPITVSVGENDLTMMLPNWVKRGAAEAVEQLGFDPSVEGEEIEEGDQAEGRRQAPQAWGLPPGASDDAPREPTAWGGPATAERDSTGLEQQETGEAPPFPARGEGGKFRKRENA